MLISHPSGEDTAPTDPQEWLAQSRPLAPRILLVRGLHYGISEAPTQETQRSLSAPCAIEDSQRMVCDAGAYWKQRFEPGLGQIPWTTRSP